MKKIVLFLFFLASIQAYAQKKNLGVGTPAPNPNAALHVESPTNDQGFIMPRLTTAQRTSLATALTATDNGLMLYDTDLKTIYIWDGTTWKNSAQVAGGNRLSYPYKDSVTNAPTGNDVLALKYNNAAAKRVLRVESLNPANGSSAVSVLQNGTGIGIFSQVNNASAGTSAIYGTTNSNLGGQLAPVGVYGESTGTGSVAGSFRINNASNTFPALYSETNGTGPATRINATNANSTAPALEVIKAGTGNAIQTTGKIQAGQFIGDGSLLTGIAGGKSKYVITDPASTDTTLTAKTYSNQPHGYAFSAIHKGTGDAAGFFLMDNATSTFPALYGENRGNGSGLVGNVISGTGNAVTGFTSGNGGNGGFFGVTNTTSNRAGLYGFTQGVGPAVMGETSSGFTAIYGVNNSAGNGFAGFFENTNAANTYPAIQANSNGTGAAIRAFQGTTNGDGPGIDIFMQKPTSQATALIVNGNHSGSGVQVNMNNPTSKAVGLNVNQRGLQSAANFNIDNAANNISTINANTNGTGNGGYFAINNTASGAAALYSTTNGTGAAFQAQTSTGFASIYGRREGATNGHAGQFDITDAGNTFPALDAKTVGTGSAANFTVNNSAATQPALNVVSNSNTAAGPGSAGKFEATGTGRALTAEINNTTNNSRAFSSTHAGLGRAGHFQNTNAANTEPTINVQSNSSTAPGININHSGTGNAITANRPIQATQFIGDGSGLTNLPAVSFPFASTVSSASNLFSLTNSGTGSAASFNTTNSTNISPALLAITNGIGAAIRAESTGNASAVSAHTTGADAIFAENEGVNRWAIWAQTTNPAHGIGTLMARTLGTGIVARFEASNSASTNPAVSAVHGGIGSAGDFGIQNPASGAAALSSTTNGTGAAIQGQTATGFTAVYGRREGATNGNAGLFEITDAGNTFPALQSKTVGTGSAANFNTDNAANTAPAVFVTTNGTGAAIQGQTSTGFASVYGRREGATTGSAGQFDITNAGNGGAALQAGTVGTGSAGSFIINNASNGSPALLATSNTNNYTQQADAVRGIMTGTGGAAGSFTINNASNSIPALVSQTNGTGSAAYFAIDNAASGAAGIFSATNGTGEVAYFSHNGASGNIAIFANNFVNVARIDKTGKGFFNGGTQNSGADVAEMFEVEGTKNQYEPGDVLIISESNDRTVEKSSAPASTKVVGVYATKPGVVLTEKNIEESLDELVPMGVIGVIPTKVCLENGPIKRGDLLVTSSKQGHAMKAIPVNVGGVLIYPTGAILGKALENFDGQEAGLIKVLVNVK